MSEYILGNKINKSKVFLVKRSELEKRLDPFYYIPEIVELEKQVWKQNPKPLRDYVITISSGATPKTTESEKYYSDMENGIPFLRVQNLSPTGILEYDGCKYINLKTHNKDLKRSQVSEGDLLIKITGVGRMAVASVAPEGFEGNINQHIVVVKTGDKNISEILAAYLNSDIAEKLASRRATGGTRPALDYPALLSIPIIFDKRILEIIKKAVKLKNIKEQKAQNTLSKIDDYLLNELGITLPKKENSLKNRIFTVAYKGITERRIDPEYNQNYYLELDKLIDSRNDIKLLKDITSLIDYGLMPTQDYAKNSSEGIPFIRVTNIKVSGEIDMTDIKYIPNNTPRIHLKKVIEDDILMVQCGSTTGKVAIVPKFCEGYLGNSFSFIIRGKNSLNQYYLFSILMSSFVQEQLMRTINIVSVRPNTSKPSVENLKIPVPSISKQNEIAENVRNIRLQAKTLKEDAQNDIIKAKKDIEKLILKN